MTATRIVLSGIRASGRHGANPGERDAPQAFVVDLVLLVDAGDGDALRETVDYRGLVDTARRVVEHRSFELLETLARAVAREILDVDRVERVTATVHKPGAAASMGVDDVAVEATAG